MSNVWIWYEWWTWILFKGSKTTTLSTVAVRLLELPSTVLYLTVRRLISKDVFGGGFSSCGLHYPDGQGSLPLHDYGHCQGLWAACQAHLHHQLDKSREVKDGPQEWPHRQVCQGDPPAGGAGTLTSLEWFWYMGEVIPTDFSEKGE